MPEDSTTETVDTTTTDTGAAGDAEVTNSGPAGDAVADWAAEAEKHKAEARKWEAMAKKHEARVKSAGTSEELAELRRKAKEYDALAEASKTEHELALDAARAEAAKNATEQAKSAFTTRLVTAQFAVALAGRMDADTRTELLDGLDLSKFVDGDGEVDVERVQKFADRVAPEQPKERRPADLGQGSRPPVAKERPTSLGAAIAGHYQAK